MPYDSATIQYSLREPFEQAVESLCNSLITRGLKVSGQLDLSSRVKRTLGIVLPPCRVVLVMPDPSKLSGAGVHPWAATFLPLHIVVSASDAHTEIQVQNRVQAGSEGAVAAIFGPVIEAQAQVAEAVEAIAMRPSMVA
jgi:uncharacterized protein (DUF302 family)